MSDKELETVFNSFCAFGAGKSGPAQMDNSKFAKIFRDLKILDKKLTATDIDIIFNRPEVKSKTARKIDFEGFKKALIIVAETKYGAGEEHCQKLKTTICAGKGPKTSGTTKTTKTGAVDRLTDTSQYTGSHKERFDERGKGRGLEGRKDFDENAAEGYVGGYKGRDTYDKTH